MIGTADILTLVSSQMRVPVDYIIGRSHAPEVRLARYAVAYLAYHFAAKSDQQIAKVLGNRERTTVFHLRQRAGEIAAVDDDYGRMVMSLAARIEAQKSGGAR